MRGKEELDEDLTPGRTEVDPTSHHYQRKREKQANGFSMQRLKNVAQTASRRNVLPKPLPLKLPAPPRHTSMQEEYIHESRKAEIVKEILKKGKKKEKNNDKFEPDPELNTTFVRSQAD